MGDQNTSETRFVRMMDAIGRIEAALGRMENTIIQMQQQITAIEERNNATERQKRKRPKVKESPDVVRLKFSDHVAAIDYLNVASKSKYDVTNMGHIRLLSAIFAQGYNLSDVKMVIDRMVKDWTGTEYEPYLRPETLFGSKFVGYMRKAVKSVTTKEEARYGRFSNSVREFIQGLDRPASTR